MYRWFPLLWSLVAALALASNVDAACSGIDYTRAVERTWAVYRFFETDTRVPVVVTLTSSHAPATAKVDVFDGVRWRALDPLESVDGLAVRVLGRARVVYRVNGCGDVIEPEDK